MKASELTRDERIERGNDLFEREIEPALGPDAEPHHFVAINVETGDYEVGDDELTVTGAIVERDPEIEGYVFLRRVGTPYTYKMGMRFQPSLSEPKE